METNRSGWGNGSEWSRPSLDMSQRAEVGYQLVFFALGTPINTLALVRHARRAKGKGLGGGWSRLAALGVHLMVANLLVLSLHCLVRTAWMLVYFWPAGDVLCKLWSAASNFSFHLVSNVVVALAVDMLVCVRSPLRAQVQARELSRRLIAVAYASAALFAAPQLFLRGTVTVPGFEPAEQCYILYYHRPEIHRAHAIFDALTMFYIPLILIVSIYTLIGSQIRLHVASGRRLRRSSKPAKSSAEALKYRTLVGDMLVVRLTALHDHQLQTTLRERFPHYHRSPSNPSHQGDPARSAIEEEEEHCEGETDSAHEGASHVTVNSAQPFRPTVQSCSTTHPLLHDLHSPATKRKSLSMVDMADLERFRNHQVRKTAVHQPQVHPPHRARRQSRGVVLKRRVLKSSVVVVLTYFVSWLPYQMVTLWRLLCGRKRDGGCGETLSSYEWLEALQLASACLSPFVYRLGGLSSPSRPRHPHDFTFPPSTSALLLQQSSVPSPKEGLSPRPRRKIPVLANFNRNTFSHTLTSLSGV